MIYFLISFLLFCTSCSPALEKNHQITTVQEKAVKDTIPVSAEYIMGKFDPSDHPDFIVIPEKYADQKGRYIRKDVFDAYLVMFSAAQKDGIDLVIISATRNFEAQKKIWEDKWFGRKLLTGGVNAWTDIKSDSARAVKILEFSSMPGTSRHHWGTDIDLNALNNEYFASGKGKKVFDWLQKNAGNFGFCQTYTAFDNNRSTGYQEEKWHWSYTPVSLPLTSWAKKYLKNDKIKGFSGDNTVSSVQVVEKYVLGINQKCMKK